MPSCSCTNAIRPSLLMSDWESVKSKYINSKPFSFSPHPTPNTITATKNKNLNKLFIIILPQPNATSKLQVHQPHLLTDHLYTYCIMQF